MLGNYATSLKVHFSSCGTTDTVANFFNVANLNPLIITSVMPGSPTAIGDSLKYTLTPAVSGGVAPYNFNWHFGDGDTSSLNAPSHTYDTAGHTQYSGYLTVIDKVGNTASTDYTVQVNRSAPLCMFNYTMSKPTLDTTVISNSKELSGITIIYTDALGKVYTSKNAAQSGASKFQITSVSDYQKNLNNQSTKMLKVTFDCWLYPSSGSPVQATGCTAIIAVAYK